MEKEIELKDWERSQKDRFLQLIADFLTEHPRELFSRCSCKNAYLFN